MFATLSWRCSTPTVVNVSLPHIAARCRRRSTEATWVLTSYLRRERDHPADDRVARATFGRKRLLMMSVTGFTVSSFLCGIRAENLSSLIFRVLESCRAPSGGALQRCRRPYCSNRSSRTTAGRDGFGASALSSRRSSAPVIAAG